MISKDVAKDISLLTYDEIYPLWIAIEHRTGTLNQSVLVHLPWLTPLDRPDLNQFIINPIVIHDGNPPVMTNTFI